MTDFKNALMIFTHEYYFSKQIFLHKRDIICNVLYFWKVLVMYTKNPSLVTKNNFKLKKYVEINKTYKINSINTVHDLKKIRDTVSILV